MNTQLAEKRCRWNFALRNCGNFPPGFWNQYLPSLVWKQQDFLSGKCPLCQESCYKKKARYVSDVFPYSCISFTWAVMCWSLAESTSKSCTFSVFCQKGKKQGQNMHESRSPSGAPSYTEAMCSPMCFPKVNICPPSSLLEIHVHKIPVRKFWLCEMRRYVGCLNVLLFFTANLRNLTFNPCVVLMLDFIKILILFLSKNV